MSTILILALMIRPPCPVEPLNRGFPSEFHVNRKHATCLSGPGGGDWWPGDCYHEERIQWHETLYAVDWHPQNPQCRNVIVDCVPCAVFDFDRDGDRDLQDSAQFQNLRSR